MGKALRWKPAEYDKLMRDDKEIRDALRAQLEDHM
jgi:hypothetical protein